MNLNLVRVLHNCRPNISHSFCVTLKGNIEVSILTGCGVMLVKFYFGSFSNSRNDIDMVVELYDKSGCHVQTTIFYLSQPKSEFESNWNKLKRTRHFQSCKSHIEKNADTNLSYRYFTV